MRFVFDGICLLQEFLPEIDWRLSISMYVVGCYMVSIAYGLHFKRRLFDPVPAVGLLVFFLIVTIVYHLKYTIISVVIRAYLELL